jgi:hypothetical protein
MRKTSFLRINNFAMFNKIYIYFNLLRDIEQCCLDLVNKDLFFLQYHLEYYLRIFKYLIYNKDLAVLPLTYVLSSLQRYRADIE